MPKILQQSRRLTDNLFIMKKKYSKVQKLEMDVFFGGGGGGGDTRPNIRNWGACKNSSCKYTVSQSNCREGQ